MRSCACWSYCRCPRPLRPLLPTPAPQGDGCCTFVSTALGPVARGQAVYFPLGFADRVSLVASPWFAPTAEDHARTG